MKKIILTLIIFSSISLKTFALDATLETTNKQIDINNPIDIKLTIESDETDSWAIEIQNIKWLDNFDIVNQSQYQNSSTSISVIDWKTQKETKIKNFLELSLKAKKSWDYTIWPVVIKSWENTIETNSIDLKVEWEKIFLNNQNNTNNSQTITNNNPQNNIIQNNPSNQTNDLENIVKKDFNSPFINIIKVIIILIIISWLTYFSLKKISEEKANKEDKREEINDENKEDVEEENNNNYEIVIPTLESKSFDTKVEEFFKNILKQKFNTDDINNINQNSENYEKIKKIQNEINKLKYSNLEINKKELLEEILKLKEGS